MVLIPNLGNSNITLIKDLIAEGSIVWNYEVIDITFLHFEGNQIK
jgi:hypothetical protein